MKEFLLALIVLFAVAGCAAHFKEAQQANIPMAQKPLIPATESACTSAGQFWVEQGIPGGGKSCAVKTTDAHKICTDSLQCQGSCLVANSLPSGSNGIGICSGWVANFGCYKYIENGRVRAVCAD